MYPSDTDVWDPQTLAPNTDNLAFHLRGVQLIVRNSTRSDCSCIPMSGVRSRLVIKKLIKSKAPRKVCPSPSHG